MTVLAVCCCLFHGSKIRSLEFFPYLRITAAAFQTFALHPNAGLLWPYLAAIFVYWHSLIPESIHLEQRVKEFILFSQQHRDQKPPFDQQCCKKDCDWLLESELSGSQRACHDTPSGLILDYFATYERLATCTPFPSNLVKSTPQVGDAP